VLYLVAPTAQQLIATLAHAAACGLGRGRAGHELSAVSSRSLKRLVGVHPRLVALVMEEAIGR
jgi:hypothetical protein